MVLGVAGAGKTTFTRRLAARIGAPAIILDEIWRPDWGHSDLATFRDLVVQAHAGETWVSDGNFAVATFDIRLPRADLILWLERPRWLTAWRATTRVVRSGEAHRPGDLAKVLKFIWNFDRVNRPKIEAARLEHGPTIPVIRLGDDGAVAAFLEQVKPAG